MPSCSFSPSLGSVPYWGFSWHGLPSGAMRRNGNTFQGVLGLRTYFQVPQELEMNTDSQQQTGVDNAKLEQLIRENTDLTKSMHRLLMGEPEYKRPGLVEIVDRHEKLVTRGGGIFITCYVIWELIKVFHPHLPA